MPGSPPRPGFPQQGGVSLMFSSESSCQTGRPGWTLEHESKCRRCQILSPLRTGAPNPALAWILTPPQISCGVSDLLLNFSLPLAL